MVQEPEIHTESVSPHVHPRLAVRSESHLWPSQSPARATGLTPHNPDVCSGVPLPPEPQTVARWPSIGSGSFSWANQGSLWGDPAQSRMSPCGGKKSRDYRAAAR